MHRNARLPSVLLTPPPATLQTVPHVFLSLGSNIDAERNLRTAAVLLRKEWLEVHFSSVYRTAAREVSDQPDFLNAIAHIQTTQNPQEVVPILQSIEKQLGKAPPFRFGPRTIDLDLLLYDNLVLNDEIIIPHPRMQSRRFVLEPLCELIDPHARHPTLKQTWENLLAETLEQECNLTPILL